MACEAAAGGIVAELFFPPTCFGAVAEARAIREKRLEALVLLFRTHSTFFSISLCFEFPHSSSKRATI